MSTYVEYGADISKYESAMSQMQNTTDKTMNFMSSAWVKAAGAMYAVIQAWDMAQLAAKAQQEEQAFRNMAASFGESADAMIAKLEEASVNTIDTSDLMAKAGQAMMAGLKPDEITQFMEIARAAARLTGDTVGEAFNKITDAAMKGTDRQLKAMGIIVDTESAYQRLAKELDVNVNQLTDAEKRQAFLNATLIAGEDAINRIGASTKNASEMFQSFGALVKNLKEELGGGLLVAIKWVVVAFTAAGVTINQVFESITKGLSWFIDFLKIVPGAETERLNTWSAALAGLGEQFQLAKEEGLKFGTELMNMDKAGASGGFIAPMGSTAERNAGPAGPAGTRNRESEALDKELAKIKMKEFEELGKAEWESWNVKEANITESLYKYRQQQLEIETGFSQQKLSLNQWEADAQLQIFQAEAAEENRITAEKEKLQAQGYANMLQNAQYAFRELGKTNKAAFTMWKATAIAETLINTYKAAMGAYSAMSSIPVVGPALGIAAAAAAIAAGMAQISAISSTEPGGGAGGGGGIGGGAVGTYSASPSTGLPTGIPAGAEQQKSSLTINIQGDMIGDEGYVELLAEKISKAVEDRDVRLVSSNSKFAERVQ